LLNNTSLCYEAASQRIKEGGNGLPAGGNIRNGTGMLACQTTDRFEALMINGQIAAP